MLALYEVEGKTVFEDWSRARSSSAGAGCGKEKVRRAGLRRNLYGGRIALQQREPQNPFTRRRMQALAPRHIRAALHKPLVDEPVPVESPAEPLQGGGVVGRVAARGEPLYPAGLELQRHERFELPRSRRLLELHEGSTVSGGELPDEHVPPERAPLDLEPTRDGIHPMLVIWAWRPAPSQSSYGGCK